MYGYPFLPWGCIHCEVSFWPYTLFISEAIPRTAHLLLKMMMGMLAFENNQGLWNGGYYSQFFGIGGVMVTVAILWLSTGYFGGIGAPFAPYFWPYLG
jgi:hypothetical protein